MGKLIFFVNFVLTKLFLPSCVPPLIHKIHVKIIWVCVVVQLVAQPNLVVGLTIGRGRSASPRLKSTSVSITTLIFHWVMENPGSCVWKLCTFMSALARKSTGVGICKKVENFQRGKCEMAHVCALFHLKKGVYLHFEHCLERICHYIQTILILSSPAVLWHFSQSKKQMLAVIQLSWIPSTQPNNSNRQNQLRSSMSLYLWIFVWKTFHDWTGKGNKDIVSSVHKLGFTDMFSKLSQVEFSENFSANQLWFRTYQCGPALFQF